MAYEPDEELPNGYLRRHSWRSGVATHFEIARIQDALAREPEILGFAADDAEQRFIIVVDPERATGDLASLADRWSSLQSTIPLTVQASCHGGSELTYALDTLQSVLAGDPETRLTYSLDISEGRYDVLADPAHRDVAELLKGELGELVEVTYGSFGNHGRFDDGTPHYGAAALWFSDPSSGDCTAGFVVNKGAQRGAVSAGHCAAAVGEAIFSGIHPWGEVGTILPQTLLWDMAYIEPSYAGETWSPRIHTDPCCPSNRPVTAKSPPYATQLVCISGRNFLAKCSVEVFATGANTSIYDDRLGFNVVRGNIFKGRRTGVNIAKVGDSGAPLYVPVGVGNAAIVGMHIAGLNATPFDQTWFHSVSDIETQLGVTVAY